ncbi:glycosyl transferase [Bernardetia litoralis DSM 6794]|uniref:Glycosyl transferase n=1 Tax=Bernardetia litoralis (strain ATCC 23117 / DSM 6794 / NBRC 15988 / NCIMB 1366 / Fx l1 / Sio-4) TaxID=880071 RepID=I4AHA6_BERLS|nr:glycosyl transferase [Bernardetia litoralis DSM 6794]
MKSICIIKTPFFSVIIPTYNRANLIVATLDSIFNQIFDRELEGEIIFYEVILVDDGSTDTTREVIETTYLDTNSEKFESRLRYFQKDNEERSAARNFGIDKARGSYILFFDSDDFMQSHHLQTLYTTIKENPEAQFLATKFEFENEGKIFPSHISHLKEGFYDYKLILEGSYFGTLVCFDRKLIESKEGLKPFPTEFNICEDWIFLFRNLFAHNIPIYVIDKTTITVNDHPNRSMADNQKVILARLEATIFLENEVELSNSELNILKGYSYQFCAVHSYIDKNRKQAFGFWKKMVSYLGYNKNTITLGIKVLIGKSVIEKLK